MSKKPDGVDELVKDFEYRGGMAFPFVVPHAGTHEIFPGMSLLDYFAGQAMQSLLMRGWIGEDNRNDLTPYEEIESEDGIGPSGLAADSYVIAQAMLKAREEAMNDRGSD